MDLYVLRHGIAEDRDHFKYQNDGLRPLTRRGRRRLARQVRGLNSFGLSLDMTIASPLVRAAQTAEIVHRELKRRGRLVTSDTLAPGGDHSALMGDLAASYDADSNVMIVGHEPDLSGLISVLTTGTWGPVIRMRKGALCKLRLPSPGYGPCGWIEWMLTAKQMTGLS